jgi:hypothetical protein
VRIASSIPRLFHLTTNRLFHLTTNRLFHLTTNRLFHLTTREGAIHARANRRLARDGQPSKRSTRARRLARARMARARTARVRTARARTAGRFARAPIARCVHQTRWTHIAHAQCVSVEHEFRSRSDTLHARKAFGQTRCTRAKFLTESPFGRRDAWSLVACQSPVGSIARLSIVCHSALTQQAMDRRAMDATGDQRSKVCEGTKFRTTATESSALCAEPCVMRVMNHVRYELCAESCAMRVPRQQPTGRPSVDTRSKRGQRVELPARGGRMHNNFQRSR